MTAKHWLCWLVMATPAVAAADRLVGPGLVTTAARDRTAAVAAQRPHAATLPGLGERHQFKGFTAEASFLRRRQATAADGVTWEAGPRNDPAVDHVRVQNGRRVGFCGRDGGGLRHVVQTTDGRRVYDGGRWSTGRFTAPRSVRVRGLLARP